MSALDIIPDFGERTGADGQLLDEFGAVLVHMPQELGVDGVLLATEICRCRCSGRGDLEGALARWWPEDGVLQ